MGDGIPDPKKWFLYQDQANEIRISKITRLNNSNIN